MSLGVEPNFHHSNAQHNTVSLANERRVERALIKTQRLIRTHSELQGGHESRKRRKLQKTLVSLTSTRQTSPAHTRSAAMLDHCRIMVRTRAVQPDSIKLSLARESSVKGSFLNTPNIQHPHNSRPPNTKFPILPRPWSLSLPSNPVHRGPQLEKELASCGDEVEAACRCVPWRYDGWREG